jgi:hypothetical protein
MAATYEDAGIGVDHRRASDPQGVNIAARELGPWDRHAQGAHPELGAVGRVERQHRILLGHRNDSRSPTRATGHVERLGIGRPWQERTECRVAPRARRGDLRHARVNVPAVPRPVEMMLEDITGYEAGREHGQEQPHPQKRVLFHRA